jgi:glycosyltransferase involved in cell wall biosynthesis
MDHQKDNSNTQERFMSFDISVVIPYHNEAATVRTTLEMVARQTFLPREVILVDSASSDSSHDIIDQWIDAYDRRNTDIRFVNLRAGTSVPGSSKNAGVRVAASDHIAFMDCGLLFGRNWLEKQVHYMQRTGARVVSGGCFLEGEGTLDRAAVAQTYGFQRFRPCVPSTLLEKSVFTETGPFLENLRAGYDVDWLNKLKTHEITRHINPAMVLCYNGVNYAATIGQLFSKSIAYSATTVGIHRYYFPYFYLLLFLLFGCSFLAGPLLPLSLMGLYLAARGIAIPLLKSRQTRFVLHDPALLAMLPFVGTVMDCGKLVGYGKAMLSAVWKRLRGES